MPKRLSDITVTHISLVKAGANKKTIIYKSDESEPVWSKDIEIKKSDDEKGIVYGIVYSPDEVDTQGDFAKAEDIEKAAYDFMKQKRVDNIDKNHSFKKEKAFVCESWIVKSGDPLFKDEKEGSWAVGIKIEDEELKKAIKKGEIKALSMAGVAKKTDEKLTKEQNLTIDGLVEALKKVFNSVNFSIGGYAYQKQGEDVEKEEKTLDTDEVAKVFKEAIASEIEPLKKEIDELKKENGDLKDELKKHQEALDKSAQVIDLNKQKKDDDSIVA